MNKKNAPIDYPAPFIQYLAEYHGSRDYFECLEIMEEYWKQQGPTSLYAGSWLVLIRIPVALYHARRGNWVGALKMLEKASCEIDAERMCELGLDGDALAASLAQRVTAWKDESTRRYEDLELPIRDPELEKECIRECEKHGWTWKRSGHETEDDIVHRHMRRDRSDVVEARRLSAEARTKARGQSAD